MVEKFVIWRINLIKKKKKEMLLGRNKIAFSQEHFIF